MQPQVDQLIHNKYRLVRLIGEGGMGSVWEARHELLGTSVALKFLHGQLAKRKGLVERFLQEAQVSARIKSPHVVQVSDVDRTSDGLAFMVMELIDGQSLQARYEALFQRGERLEYGSAFEIALQLLEGVGAAHRLGIVHRDLKPDNVMLLLDAKGRTLVKILDFGIAKLKASGEVDRGLTRPGMVMGTPEYMAPEQAFSADKVDARADVFSLGVMLFEMLAGRRPVGGDDAHAIVAQYIDGNVPRLRDLKPTIAEGLAAAVHKAMAAKAEDRFATVEEFAAAILPYAPEGTLPPAGPSIADALADTADRSASVQARASAEARAISAAATPAHASNHGASSSIVAASPSAVVAPASPSATNTPTGTTAMPVVADLLGSAPPPENPRPNVSTAPAMPVMVPSALAAAAPPRPGGTQIGESAPPFSATPGMPLAHTPQPVAPMMHGGPPPYAPAQGLPSPYAGVPVPPQASPGRGGRPSRSMGGIVAVAGVLTVLVLGGVFAAQRWSHEDDSSTTTSPPRATATPALPTEATVGTGNDLAPTNPPDTVAGAQPPDPTPGTPPSSASTARPTARPTPTGAPSTSPTGTPSATPSSGPPGRPGPWVLPSQLPKLPTIPGLPPLPPLPFPGAPAPPSSPEGG